MESGAIPLWAIATIAGPVILGAAFAYAVWRNRRKRKKLAAEGRSERGL